METKALEKKQATPIDRLKNAINSESVQQQFRNALAENAGPFIASLIDIYGSDSYLQQCEPKAVIMEALKAATLKLPINKSLGFAYIVPYKKDGKPIPTMIIGYKGYLQLSQRTAQYRYINADVVYEGEKVTVDRLTGEVFFSGEPKSEKSIGYFAHIETTSGFRKTIFWTREKVEAHAKRYSQSYGKGFSPWNQHFDAMAIKTVLRHLLSKYGVMSLEMINALDHDSSDERAYADAQDEADAHGNQGEVIDIKPEETKQEKQAEPEDAPY